MVSAATTRIKGIALCPIRILNPFDFSFVHFVSFLAGQVSFHSRQRIDLSPFPIFIFSPFSLLILHYLCLTGFSCAGSVTTDIISPLVHPKVQRYYRTDIRLCQDTSTFPASSQSTITTAALSLSAVPEAGVIMPHLVFSANRHFRLR